MKPHRSTVPASTPHQAVPDIPVGSPDPKDKTVVVLTRRGPAFADSSEDSDALASQGGVA